jgi:branched-chain amino acid transport system permease protein
MKTQFRFNWLEAVKSGLIGGIVALLLVLVGMVEMFGKRDIIGGVISMGHTLLLFPLAMATYLAVHRAVKASGEEARPAPLALLASGAVAGLVAAACVAVLVFVGGLINLRAVFLNASPGLYEMLTFGQSRTAGILLLLAVGAGVGLAVTLVYLLPGQMRRSVLLGLITVVLLGLVQELLRVMLDGWGKVGGLFDWMLARKGLSIPGAVALFVVAAGGSYLWARQRASLHARLGRMPQSRQRALRWVNLALAVLLLVVLPRVVGSYPSEVLDVVGLYVLMGMGLNIVVGFAGLLDLGYVAFYALGAYTMAVLTSPEITWLNFHLSFWEALPFAVLVATLAGIILGIPVLNMRGDYLAIVTLGFGEIIRLVFLSDWLKSQLGGSNGITMIPKAVIGPARLSTPQTLYYLILAGCLLVAFVSWRLKDSRVGRTWMALREDEDVAEAMGIHLVRTKLLAFATGAAFAGLAGAILASKLTSIYPHSFHLLVSINVLCLIIVGGMGSLPGVIVGSFALVGLPELLREFAEYRYLMYGLVLVIMMLARPEGLWPEARRRLELHAEEEAVTEEELGPVSTGKVITA